MEISGSLWSSKTPLKLKWKNVKYTGLLKGGGNWNSHPPPNGFCLEDRISHRQRPANPKQFPVEELNYLHISFSSINILVLCITWQEWLVTFCDSLQCMLAHWADQEGDSSQKNSHLKHQYIDPLSRGQGKCQDSLDSGGASFINRLMVFAKQVNVDTMMYLSRFALCFGVQEVHWQQ